MEGAEYLCPGETAPISRAVHLARLAGCYPACRNCEYRGDTGSLTARRVRLIDQAHRHAGSTATSDPEGFGGIVPDGLNVALARSVAQRFASLLRQSAGSLCAGGPRLVVADDNRALSAALLQAASDAVRHVGGHVINLGSATSAALVDTLLRQQADGGLLVGNAGGGARTASLRFWGPRAMPWSSPGALDELRASAETDGRPVRSEGGASRHRPEADYLPQLEPYFHALRPLRIAVRCGSDPLWRYLRRLVSRVACQLVSASESDPGEATRFHAHVWIDGDGEALRLRDERGEPVSGGQMLLLLAALRRAQGTGRSKKETVVLEEGSGKTLAAGLKELGYRVVRCPPVRQSVFTAMHKHRAVLAGGGSGRCWFDGPRADALMALAQILVLLSRSDRPLSQVVAAPIFEVA